LLQNALQRPVSKWQYENADTFKRARGFTFGIADEHAFVDGNKRTAIVTSVTFLRLNGWHFITEPAEGVGFMEGLASDQIAADKFKNLLTREAQEKSFSFRIYPFR
jgi:death on curing protein